MTKKIHQDKSAQREMNDYERMKLLRVQENQARLRELGVHNIAKSFTSLVDSQNPKKKKKKSVDTNEKDVDCFGDEDNEGDYREVAPSVQVTQKQHRPQYIAPMSMNRVANLSKQKRVIASNVPSKFPSDSNTTKGSRLSQYKEKYNIDAPKVPSRATITMGELILSKKGLQRKDMTKRSLKQNLGKANDSTSGARRKLHLVDSDDDEMDDEMDDQRYQEVEEDVDGYEENENDGGDFSPLGVYGQDVENAGVEEMLYERIEDDVPDDGRHDIEDEDDELVEEQIEVLPSEKATELSITKKRGPTMMHGVQVRKFDDREVIICNKYGQPVGPVTEEKDIAGQFSRFLGTIARTYNLAPLTYNSWRNVPHKEKMWEYVLEKYIVPDNAKKWVVRTIGECWRGYKCRIKKKHFYMLKDNKTRWKNRPKSIPEKDFQKLLSLWNNKAVMNRCLLAKDVRMAQKNMHMAGPKSFARIHEEMINVDPNNEPPTLAQMFERTRKRKEGNTYVDTYDDTAKKIEQMKNYKPSEDGDALVDPFLATMGKEYDGHRRLYGRGVTNRLINKVSGDGTSYMVPRELMDKLRANVEKNELLDLRREIEEDHARKKAELEAMRNDIDKVVEDKFQMLLEKLPHGVLRESLT